MLALIRIRGLKDVRHDIRKTLDLLQLDRKNHLVLVPDNPVTKGMIHKVKDYIGYGKIAPETIAQLLAKRGRRPGDLRVTDDWLKQHHLASFEEAGKAIAEEKITLIALGIKPVFRLNAPRGGFARKGIKKSTRVGGSLGPYTNGIDSLVQSMM
ncbi:MAG: 50S ribosomal protein L30 [Candidatus Diapherotrites archaeon]|nr:50S ribosomal protein L30 [Candidatus Diapherotrites archaeon]MDZ4256018.1 50S ribosomal protein L30 [archaeon]